MKIRVINPIVITKVDFEPLMREAYADSHDPSTTLDFVFLEKGIESPEQHFWEELQMTYLIQEIERTDQQKYDGVVIFCAADPGIPAAKEWLDIPVVGILESSVAMACLLGRRFTWLSPLSCGNSFIQDRIAATGQLQRLASIRSIEVPVVEMHDNKALLAKTIQEGRLAVEQDGADSLILGCTGMMSLAREAEKELGIPVIDAGELGIRMCELLVKTGLKQSKKAYPTPRSTMGRKMG